MLLTDLDPQFLRLAFLSSAFIRNLFPEDVSTDKRGRPTTASNKIKVKMLRHSYYSVPVNCPFVGSIQKRDGNCKC